MPSGQCYATVMSDVVFAITSYGEIDTISINSRKVKPQGKFLLVNLSVLNTRKEAISVDPTTIKLLDKRKRQFPMSPEVMTLLKAANGETQGFLKQVNTGVLLNTTLIFDVPLDFRMLDCKLELPKTITGNKFTMVLQSMKTGY